MAMRVINISDGYGTDSAPSQGSIQQNSFASYATDAAYVTGKGSAAAAGDAYYNTTNACVRVYTSEWVNYSIDNSDAILGAQIFS